MQNTIATGTQFTNKDSRGWRDADNNRHRHTYTLLCEVTSTSGNGIEWRTVKVLSENDRPSEGAFTPEKGAMAWFGLEAAQNRGDVETIG